MSGYEKLVESQGCEVIDSLYMGSYQGDILMIVRNKSGQFGILTTGYGSCSGCDALEAAESTGPDAVESLAKRLYDGVVWQEPESIIEYLDNKDWEGEYYGQAISHEYVEDLKEKLMVRYLGGF